MRQSLYSKSFKAIFLTYTELLKEILTGGASSTNTNTNGSTESTNARRRKASGGNKDPESTSDSSTEKNYTPEQVADVKRLIFFLTIICK